MASSSTAVAVPPSKPEIRRVVRGAFVAAAMLAGLLLSLAFCARTEGTTNDGLEYMTGGMSLWSGHGYRTMMGQDDVIFPPGYPILIGALWRLLHDPILAGRLVSLIASLLAILLVYLLASKVSPGRPATIAAWLFALLPVRVMTSGMVWSESLFVALALGGVLAWIAAEDRPRYAVGGGALLGAAYLTRPEGLLILAVGAAARLASGSRRAASWKQLALLVMGFAIISSPYLLYLRTHTGAWRLTGKMETNLAVAEARARNVPWEMLYTLSPDDRTVITPTPTGGLRELADRYLLNVRRETSLLLDTFVLGPYLLACAGLGLVATPWTPRARRAWPLVLALAAPVLVLPVFFVESRMLLVALAPALVLAGTAFARADDLPARQAPPTRLLLSYGLLAVAATLLVKGNADLHTYYAPINYQPLMAAVQRTAEAPGPIVGNKGLAFKTGRLHLTTPYEPLARVLRYARYHEAAFMVVTTRDHPELAGLALDPITTEDLLPVARVEYHAADEPVIEQLYRLRPAHSTNRRIPKA